MTGAGSAEAEGPARPDLPKGSVPRTELPLKVGAAVITDLHLAPLGDGRTRAFCEWADRLSGLPQLLILGDFFDTWVGAKQARIPGSAEILAALRRLSERGTQVHLIPGNRDALLDRSFEAASAARLHPEGFVGVLPCGRRATFVHGDSLCTLDHGYQQLRKMWRRGPVRFTSRHAPLWIARWVGGRLRRASESRKPFKLVEEKSIQRAAVLDLARLTRAEAVVCGHAHIARDEPCLAAGDPADDAGRGPRWIVVGAWREDQPDSLLVTAAGPADGANDSLERDQGLGLVPVASNSLGTPA